MHGYAWPLEGIPLGKDGFGLRVIDAESVGQLIELFEEDVAAGVDMFGFGDEFDPFVGIDIMADEDFLELAERGSVDDEHFVFVKLDFLAFGGVEDRNSGATIIEEHLFKVIQGALKDGHIDMFAVEILMVFGGAMVAGLEDHIDTFAEWFEEVHEEWEKAIAGGGSHDYGDFDLRLGVDIFIVSETLTWHDLEVVGGANGIG